MAKSSAQTLTFKSVTDRQTDKQTDKNKQTNKANTQNNSTFFGRPGGG